jgi:hypothetical protein
MNPSPITPHGGENEMKVYAAIAAVMGDLAKRGISKNETNTFDKYKFRGIDAVYNALAPLLSAHGLLILPRVLERTSEERVSQKGGAVFYVTVAVEFDFVCAEDGSKHTIRAYGEAMDRGDKGTNKAMTAAYKYACFEAFCIPTEGADDADSDTHEVQAREEADTQAWIETINGADMPESLYAMGAEFAKAKLSAKSKAAIRAAFSARKNELKKAA